jgi:hypothetical protein
LRNSKPLIFEKGGDVLEFDEEDHLEHYGIQRRSGRYPWGSGGNVSVTPPRNMTFLDQVKWLKNHGLSQSEIAQGFGMTMNDLRAAHSIESNALRQANIAMATRLQDEGNSNTAIGKRMGINESTVRSLLAPGAKDKADSIQNTMNMLKNHVSEKGLVDVGKGQEYHIGVTRTKLDTALSGLKQEGYSVHLVPSLQATRGRQTTKHKILGPPGTTQRDMFLNRDKIRQITDFTEDHGKTYGGLKEPLAISPRRIEVVHKEKGGDKADGMIYVRPGIDDISIGGSSYAQVRVAVGKNHYLKGMAMYKDDLPAGVDIQFHTNKSNTGNKLDAMKLNKDEPGYIEGGPHVLLKSINRQIIANPGTSKERVTSAMNIIHEEGEWEKWSNKMSSQMLSKQSPILAKSQLDMTYENRLNEFDAINKLTNATVRKKLLTDFGDATDSAAVHLSAAALPRTVPHVILPVSTLPSTQIFAPRYKNGEKVVLIRHPHSGPFEIPELVVNNRHRDSIKLLGKDPRDAIGINHEVAQRMSGGDFDGDHVLVIPNNARRVQHSKALDGLKGFDPSRAYPGFPGMKPMRNTQNEMGQISNLITDMSIRNAPHSDLAQAVRHSMVVIDAEKKNLNYKQSANDNNIKALKAKYQSGGASTIISRARAEQWVPERQARRMVRGGPIDPKTGRREFEPTGRLKSDGTPRQSRVARLSLTTDARTLVSRPGTPIERMYADHANKLKALANKSRLAAIKTPTPKQSASAKKVYADEVKSLNESLARAQRNLPLERQANLIANTTLKSKRDANPNMDEATEKKVLYQALVAARLRTGAQKHRIDITPKEWEAIQAGAISDHKLKEILNSADMSIVRELAMPKTEVLMTPAKLNRAAAMLASGFTRAEVASHLGVSLSTLDKGTSS